MAKSLIRSGPGVCRGRFHYLSSCQRYFWVLELSVVGEAGFIVVSVAVGGTAVLVVS